MQLFKLVRKIQPATRRVLVVSLLFINGFSFAAEPIGDVIEAKGVTSITRNEERLKTGVGSGINMYDEAETANGRLLIQFLDEEQLSLTENSLVYIDEAYYLSLIHI